MKKIRYIVEATLLYLLFGFFCLLSPATASNAGGFMARSIGPRLGASGKARANIKRALPEKTDAEIDAIIKGMWDNLGRVIAEYPHLESISKNSARIVNKEIIADTIQTGNGGILIAAHLANWEVSAVSMLANFGFGPDLTYRALNNPFADRLLEKSRTLNGRIKAFPKSRDSVRDIMKTLKDKAFLGILIDQKYNEGLAVPFFGHPAMTNPVFVTLAQKFKCPLIPVQTVRTGPAQFDVIVNPPLAVFDTDGKPLPLEIVMASMHALLEGWIRQYPEQWLWLHRRWDSKQVKSS